MSARRFALAIVLVLTAAIAEPAPSRASDPTKSSPGPIAPDRPTVTANAWTVPAGYAQLEIGINHLQDNFDLGPTEIDFGVTESLVTSARFGWMDFVELQLNYLGVIDITEDATFEDGTEISREFNGNGDFDAATKLSLWHDEEKSWGLATILGLTLPTGDGGPFGTEGFDPRGAVALSGALPMRLGLDANVGFDFSTFDTSQGEETVTSLIGALALSYAIRDNMAVTLEFSSLSDFEGEARPWNSLLGVFSARVRENFQLDFSVGRGMSESAYDWSAGGGVSVRLGD